MVSWRELDLWSGCVRTAMVVADTGTILFHLDDRHTPQGSTRKLETRCKLASDFYERADE
jgi:hypothetical protein